MRFSMGWYLCVCLLALAMVALPANLYAQASNPPDSEEKLFEVEREESSEGGEGGDAQSRDQGRGRDEEDLDQMSRKQLESAGFLFSDVSVSRKRSTALVMATIPGLLLHGAGHLYLNETQTAIVLMSMEATGLALLAFGAGLPWLTQGQIASAGLSRQAFYSGMGLIISSYILDVIGVTRSDDQLAYATPEQRRGGALSLAYRFFSTPRYPINHAMRGRFNADFGRVYARASTLQDVSLFTSRYDGELGVRVFSRPNTEHAVIVEAMGGYERFRGSGRHDRWDVGAMAGGTLDLGILSPSLRRVFIGGLIGYNHQWYAYPEPRTPEEDVLQDEVSGVAFSNNTGSVPFEFFGGMNFTDKLHLRLAYSRKDGELIHDLNRLLAVPSATVIYSRTQNLDVILDAAYGGGLRLGGELRFWLW